MEEERRLCFVALTRAEKGLYLSEADGRNFDGSPRYPSRFLLDIDPALLTFSEPLPDELVREARDYIAASALKEGAQQAALAPGQRVRHAIFGTGTVLEVDFTQNAHVVQFDKFTTPRKISFRAKLDPVP